MPAKSENQELAPVTGPMSVLTPREQAIMLQSILTIKGFPSGIQIDYPKVAERLGMANHRSVTNAWGVIKKKLIEYEKKDRKDRGLPSEDEAEPAVEGGRTKPSPKKRARTTKAPAHPGLPGLPGLPALPNRLRTKTGGRGRATSAKKNGVTKKGGMLANDARRRGQDEIADPDETEDDEEAKLKAGMIKLEREVDENGVESFVSGEI
ncbi:hypothetical protein NEMBOFW57_010949 [Staphylotrichum longicolle]|uniref:Uncharacterized protein n=1 Tax=Staphylotrichum longicolle TaxID=669026 RepID=A0AAD4ENY2_9PEZI|nr:hypothetical protein NEMBOFW57_010949 [Staphylotrichum longicolle]